MALLKSRPLAAGAILLLLSTVLCFFLPIVALILLLSCTGAVLLMLALYCLHHRKCSYRALAAFLLIGGVLLGAGRILVDRIGPNRQLEARLDSEAAAVLTVREVRYTSTYETELLVKVEALDGTRNGALAILRAEGNLPYYTGDRIEGRFTLRPLEHDAYYEGIRYVYFGEGAVALLVSEEGNSIALLESGTRHFHTRLADLRAILSLRITSACEGEAGELLSAMLLGTRASLSEQTVRDFRRAGVSHLLALSGLHLMILVGILDRLLYALAVGKRARMAIVLPCCLGYWVLTGCSFSMLRAVVMLSLVYLAFFLREDHDALTALFACASGVVLLTPTALFSTSFQMTVLATLGLLSFGRLQGFFISLLPKGRGILRVLLAVARYLLASVCITLAATVAVLPVTWLTFGELSLITPLANLLLVPLAAPLLVLALLLLLLPFAPLAFLAQRLSVLVLWIAEGLSSGNVMLSLRYGFVPILFTLFFAALVLLLLVDLKRRWPLAALPVPILILAFALCLFISNAAGEDSLECVYRRNGNNEGLILVQNGVSMLCDSSNGSLTQWKADWRVAQELGATEVEVLLLTHYHAKEVTALSRFSKSVMLRALWVPQPVTEQDRAVLADLLAVATSRDISVTVYDYQAPLRIFGSGELRLTEPLYESRSTQGAFALSLSYGGEALCYHTAALSEYLRHHGAAHDCNASTLILGAHGPVPHETVEIPQNEELSCVAVGSEEILALLALRPDAVYLPFPERMYISLGSP